MRRSIGLAMGTLVVLAGVTAAVQAATVQTERIEVPEALPAPDTIIDGPLPPDDANRSRPAEAAPAEPSPPANGRSASLPEVFYDPASLPEPVRQLREILIAAASTGDVEQLRQIIEIGPTPPALSLTPIGDPIEHLRSVSGDGEGREILAILIEVLEAGYVHVDVGTPQEMYLWPYFARYPLEALTGKQMVEVFKLLTAGDFEDIKFFGAYNFFRLGIGPDGTWHFFVAGD